ncbi:hypothetical protein L1987_67738 [Smallanthus sonchifolius]|uniref:Uncharacterized protein n=1 Tax=Smallanthus sonchifolius TaxID=185202 RepID=A0ACB9B2V7_9ASTR|nr:hypothetical protein L1987_67738 [Smallanthus sonchifolius]
MTSRDEQMPVNIPQMLTQQFQSIISDDVEYLAMQLFEIDPYEESSSSKPNKKRKEINRDRKDADACLWNDYFAPTPVFDETFFRRRFRMRVSLFNRIVAGISEVGKSEHYKYFTQRYDVVGRKGLSPRQKCTSAIRQLAYGTPADLCDEYLRIGESTALECLHKFCRSVVEVYSAEYLRRPNQNDIHRLLEEHSVVHGFPGMLGSIDCMHWSWRNCPTAWRGQYTRGDHGHPTVMLEAVASHDLWIWHAFFGVAGSNNDINVLNQSPVFNQILEGNAPECNFTVNGNVYTKGYYLADGIYPEWATLVKSFTYPPENNLKMKLFKKRQESARKDVERAFGVLRARWGIIQGSARSSTLPVLGDIMHTCIILHNMIVEDEGAAITNWSREDHEPDLPSYSNGAPSQFQTHLERFRDLRSQEAHQALRSDLVQHIWANSD